MRLLVLAVSIGFALRASPCTGSVIAGSGPFAGGPLADPLGSVANVDLDGDGQPDLQASAGGAVGPGGGSETTFVGPAPGSTVQFTGPLTAGTIVNDSLAFSPSGGLREHAEIHVMEPSLNQPGGSAEGDFGFRFTVGGATHYGWADLYASAGIFLSFAGGSAGASQWAYESDPNTPITVGAVPEPASAALLLVVAPALLRRRSA